MCVGAQLLGHFDFLPPHGLQPARLLCPWSFSGKNTGVGCRFHSRGSSRPRDRTCISCSGRQILYHCATWDSQYYFKTEPGKGYKGIRVLITMGGDGSCVRLIVKGLASWRK